MRGLIILLVLGSFVVHHAVTSPLPKRADYEKRGLVEMYKIIQYYNKDRSPMDYNGYGCFCGLGGSGTPVDAVDWCCKAHDDCYSATSCWSTHLSWSTSSCSNGRCVCLDKVNSCGRQACQCDVTLATCLASAPYIKSNYGKCSKG